MSHHRNTLGFGGASTKEVLVTYIGADLPNFNVASLSPFRNVDRACDLSLHEPNMSLDLEIADLINQKKANTPREAAVEIVRLVNHRNTHIAMLALHLLDILVKNCGYPFHLQISTKDFLNELVRRFPERPPTFPPPPMAKILELIHEWKSTLCVHSKHKEDLVHIRDMHRLLSYKGYRFPDYDKRQNSVLANQTDSLQSPDELEEEDREAQAAKLQELIRRGTPKDLAAAQELMKIMSGAEPEKKPDYKQQVEKELDKIQQRILLLNEMLNNAKPTERFAEGDAFDQIAQKCRQVQPKIQKWIADSAENDPGSMDRLLLMNDLINNIVNRYDAFKAGNRSATADIDPTFQTTDSSTRAKKAAEQVSLIDFDFDEMAPTSKNASSAPTQPTNPMDDLAALSSLSMEPSSTSALQRQQVDPMSLYNVQPSTFSNSSTSSAAGGSFFANPAYGHVDSSRSSGLGPTNLGKSTTSSLSGSNSQPPPSWHSPSLSPSSPYASSPGAIRSTTPVIGSGAIQLPSSRPSSTIPSKAPVYSPDYSAKASLIGTAGPHNSTNLTAANTKSKTMGSPVPPPVPAKDAFEDLLGDW